MSRSVATGAASRFDGLTGRASRLRSADAACRASAGSGVRFSSSEVTVVRAFGRRSVALGRFRLRAASFGQDSATSERASICVRSRRRPVRLQLRVRSSSSAAACSVRSAEASVASRVRLSSSAAVLVGAVGDEIAGDLERPSTQRPRSARARSARKSAASLARAFDRRTPLAPPFSIKNWDAAAGLAFDLLRSTWSIALDKRIGGGAAARFELLGRGFGAADQQFLEFPMRVSSVLATSSRAIAEHGVDFLRSWRRSCSAAWCRATLMVLVIVAMRPSSDGDDFLAAFGEGLGDFQYARAERIVEASGYGCRALPGSVPGAGRARR